MNQINFSNITASKIIKIRQSNSKDLLQIFLLTNVSSIFLIDNFILFTKMTNDLIKEHYENGQVLKEFGVPASASASASDSASASSKVNDLFLLEKFDEILLIGSDQMITWWKIDETPQNINISAQSSILNMFSFSSAFKSSTTTTELQPKPQLKLLKFLNEPDRNLNKVVCSKGNLLILEDSVHVRLLILDIELGLIIKIFKGYRNCSALILPNSDLLLWAGNRFTLEKWEKFPFCVNQISSEEFPNCVASISEDSLNNDLFIYDQDNFELKVFEI